MKAVNVSYPDPKRWAALVGIAGPRLGTWDRVRALLSGTPVATPRVQWHGCSDPDLQSLIDATPDVKWLNAERTRGGLLLYFRVRLETYALAVSHATPVRIRSRSPRALSAEIGGIRLDFTGSPSALDGLARLFTAHPR